MRSRRHATRGAAAAALVAAASALASLNVKLDGTTALHRYDGHGALSAGASSRLLLDYAEPQRSEILDFLFKPSFGAAMHHLKVEIGGDAQSTDGTEPSWAHDRAELGGDNCGRGYEAWLLKEAKARNPAIKTYALSWGAPAWVGNGSAYYSTEGMEYHVGWLTCIRRTTGISVDYLGLHNEAAQPGGSEYVVALRQALDAAQLQGTQVIVMDGGFDADEVATATANATYAAAVYGSGQHYPCSRPHPEVSAHPVSCALQRACVLRAARRCPRGRCRQPRCAATVEARALLDCAHCRATPVHRHCSMMMDASFVAPASPTILRCSLCACARSRARVLITTPHRRAPASSRSLSPPPCPAL